MDGGCTCRQVRYRLSGTPLIVHACHCRWCQRETGAAFALNALFEADRVTHLAGEPDLVVTPSQSGKSQRIARCPACRVAVWSNYHQAGPAVRFVRVGTLDEPDRLPPDIHIFTSSKQPWLALPPGAKTVPEFYDPASTWSAASLERWSSDTGEAQGSGGQGMKAVEQMGSIVGREHWTKKGDVRLFLWQKSPADAQRKAGTILFVHGSSMASQPTFDLKVPGRPDSSVMDWFAARGFDTWCVDMEGYGRSDKTRNINFDIANGADDLAAASQYILDNAGSGPLLVYGISSGALRAAVFAERHPERVKRLALDAFVWTGKGSPTLAERTKKLAEFKAKNRRPIDKAFVYSIFNRDHPGTAEERVIEAFADAILALDDSVPTGTYVDMCSKLPLVDPAKIVVPTILMRGQWDGIAAVDDLVDFFCRLPNPDKQFAVMPGISHASFQQKNYLLVYHILRSFFSQPDPLYR